VKGGDNILRARLAAHFWEVPESRLSVWSVSPVVTNA
jgi:hypothetical protein